METASRSSHAKTNYLSADYSVKSWLLATDHKRIAILYLISVTLFFLLGGLFAMLLRLNLLSPVGELMAADTYNKLFTMHGLVMVFLFLLPVGPAVFGNFLVPLMIGARDLAFPRLSLASWYVYLAGAGCLLYSIITGGVDTGWSFYAPYSTTYADTNVVSAMLGVLLAGVSLIFTGLNIIVTMHRMRAPGLSWRRLPLFLWAQYATSVVMVLSTPLLAATMLLATLERVLHFGIFDSRLGGDPLLFQHLFWFYAHAAVYITTLPSMGVISEVIACFSRKRVFGYGFVVMSSMAIAVLGMLVWAQHMYLSGISVYAALVFSLLSLLAAIPFAVEVFSWMATLYKGSITLAAPLLYAFAFIGLITVGGLSGLFLAAPGLDLQLHNTSFVVAHFHYIMAGGAVTGLLCALHFWWPKITGKMYPEPFARLSALLVFVGFNATFFPQFLLGYMGMPRRYNTYPPEFQVLQVLSTAGASILAAGVLLPIFYLVWSLRYGKEAGSNPYRAAGLEWNTASPPPAFNFDEMPVVSWRAYNYDEIDTPNAGAEVAEYPILGGGNR
jgi:cytochrome c oxidase subunit I